MSDVIPIRPRSRTRTRQDRSLEFAIALDNAHAIADLLFTVCGSNQDGSDSQIERKLAVNTLSSAVYCIMQNVETAQEIEREKIDRSLAAKQRREEEASAGH